MLVTEKMSCADSMGVFSQAPQTKVLESGTIIPFAQGVFKWCSTFRSEKA